MYISGTALDFEERLHQLPDTAEDLDSFRTEAADYNESLLAYEKVQINREFNKKNYIINGPYSQRSIVIAGADETAANGTYLEQDGTTNGRAHFVLDENYDISWSDVELIWTLWKSQEGLHLYSTTDSPDLPWSGTWALGTDGSGAVPTVTQGATVRSIDLFA